jgi:hypothetical protein
MTTLQGIINARQEADRVGRNPKPYSAEGGTYRTRTDEEQAQFEQEERWWARRSIIKCYGSMDNYCRILRRQHGIHDHPVKPK